MKLVSFHVHGESAYGLVEGGNVRRLAGLPDFPSGLNFALEAARLGTISQYLNGEEFELDALRLRPPVPNPGKILCVATNFREQAQEGKPDPDYPLVFTRFGDTLVGHAQSLIKPRLTQKYDFEGELAVVIGRGGYRIARERAMEHVAGYSCFNDGSVRDWQKHSSQFTPGKNFYKSGSMGPWFVTIDEVPDPKALTLETRVNGVVKQAICMDRMIFDIPWLISYFSSFTPLAPGDIIATGTPSGFGSTRNPPEFLQDGDVIEVDISGVGLLCNRVCDETAEG